MDNHGYTPLHWACFNGMLRNPTPKELVTTVVLLPCYKFHLNLHVLLQRDLPFQSRYEGFRIAPLRADLHLSTLLLFSAASIISVSNFVHFSICRSRYMCRYFTRGRKVIISWADGNCIV